VVLLLLTLVVAVYSQTRVGTLFSMTNEAQNRLVAYPRFSDGTIGVPTAYLTGGIGTGLSILPNPAGPADPLFTQDAVIKNNAGDRVYCVNPGSNSVSSFIVDNTGLVQLEHVYDSGGETPVTMAISPNDRTLYIVNIGGAGRLVSVNVRAGGARYIARTNGAVSLFLTTQTFPRVQPLLTTPGDIKADPTGRYVLMSDKGASTVSAFRVGANGKLLPAQRVPPVVYQVPHNHAWPLYWVNPTTLLVGSFGPNPVNSSFPNTPSFVNVLNWDSATGALSSVSELQIATTALCWFSEAHGVYYGGTLTQFLPAFTVDAVTRQALAIAPQNGLAAGHALDQAIGFFDQYGIDGFLYNLGWLDPVPHVLYAFSVNPDGTVNQISSNGDLPISQGLTAI